MSRARTVEGHLHQLQELESIISSMKTLSQIELHKLDAISAGQHALAASLQQMAVDFYHHYPQGDLADGPALWLLLGAERGFCGDFNEALLRRLQELHPEAGAAPQQVLAVGRKLWVRMEEHLPGFTPLDGASVSEELPKALSQMVGSVQQRMLNEGAVSLNLLHHDDEAGGVVVTRLLPPELPQLQRHWSTPPLLQLSPQEFLREFLLHYLYLALNERFTLSLLVENQYRVRHLEGAVHRLDERLAELTTRARALRQEEITEEIELILLGSAL